MKEFRLLFLLRNYQYICSVELVREYWKLSVIGLSISTTWNGLWYQASNCRLREKHVNWGRVLKTLAGWWQAQRLRETRALEAATDLTRASPTRMHIWLHRTFLSTAHECKIRPILQLPPEKTTCTEHLAYIFQWFTNIMSWSLQETLRVTIFVLMTS